MAVDNLGHCGLGGIDTGETSRDAIEKGKRFVPNKGGPVLPYRGLPVLEHSGEGALPGGCIGGGDFSRKVGRGVGDWGHGSCQGLDAGWDDARV